MKTQKSVNKRAKILQAAAKILAAKGYSLTTLADVGEEAGTFAGSLYYYFPSKEHIVAEVLNIGTTSVSELVMSKVDSLPEDTSIYEKIRIALETHLQQMLAKDDFVVAYWKIIDQVPEDVRLRHLALPRRYGRFWQEMIEQAQAEGSIRRDVDARMMRLLLIGSTIYALQWYSAAGKNTPKEIADTLTEMFFCGVLPRQREVEASSKMLHIAIERDRGGVSCSSQDPKLEPKKRGSKTTGTTGTPKRTRGHPKKAERASAG